MIQLSTVDSEAFELLAIARFRRAFRLLLEASAYAHRISCDPWEFAIDMRECRRLRLTENDLRFLVLMKFVDHANEVTTSSSSSRIFQPTVTLRFTKRTCFVLTRLGTSVAEGVAAISKNAPHLVQGHALSRFASPKHAILPIWDAPSRLLSFRGRTVKQLKFRAINQGQILSAFQEENWPRRILDPLSPQPCQDVKRRLNDTIKCLNRGHQDRLLRFGGDGTGEGIIWEFVG